MTCLSILLYSQIKLNDTVEIFLIDEGYGFDFSHPIHIHGYSPYIIAMERHANANPQSFFPGFNEDPENVLNKAVVKEWNEQGIIKKNLKDPPQKDTVAVPDAGFVIMRFRADNPGFWIMHCHMSWHNHVGMGVIIQVLC